MSENGGNQTPAPAASGGGGAWNWTALSEQAVARNTAHAEQKQAHVAHHVRVAAAAARRTSAVQSKSKPPSSASTTRTPTNEQPELVQPRDPHVDTEKFSGLRISARTVPADDLETEMNGRKFIPLRQMDVVSRDVLTDDQVDWVTIGVVARKTLSKATAQGSSFMVWALSDLNETELAVFLFDGGYDAHWRALEGSIVAVLNAPLMPANEKNKFALKASKPEDVVVLGKSIDFGICKGMNSADVRCRLVVNTAKSQYCLHHIASSFMAAGKRRQQLNNSFSTFNKSIFSSKSQLKNISAGVYGAKPIAGGAMSARSGSTIRGRSGGSGGSGGGGGWQPIITNNSNKRRRTDSSTSSAAAGRLGVPTVISTTGSILQRPVAAPKKKASLPASFLAGPNVSSNGAAAGPAARTTRGEKIIASILASATAGSAMSLPRASKTKKVDMMKFMNSGNSH